MGHIISNPKLVGGVVDEVVDVGVVTATVVAVGTRQSAKVVELQ